MKSKKKLFSKNKFPYNATTLIVLVVTSIIVLVGFTVIVNEMFIGSGVYESAACSGNCSKPVPPKGNVVTRAAGNISSGISKVVGNSSSNIKKGICAAVRC